MADDAPLTEKIIRIVVDEAQRIRLSPAVEQERRAALFDLIEENSFRLNNGKLGPYVVFLSVEEGRILKFRVYDQAENDLDDFTLFLSELQSIIKDYFLICESYVDAIRTLPPSRIEAIDMGRRGLHNEGADILRERLANKVTMDKDTARRLFTLVCVMHIRG
ncbi:MAG: UPF0262 family protein [Rhodospirillales bacterium]